MATIRKRQRKSGEVYIVQVKATDKGSGQKVVRSRTWKPDAAMTPKQAERAVIVFADAFEREVKESISGINGINQNPDITFQEFANQWLEKIRRDHSLSYYERSKDCLKYTYRFIGGYKLRDLTPAILQTYFNKLDERKKIVTRIAPKGNFREVLKSYELNYMKLRYDYHIQSCTLANAFTGKNVSRSWSEDFCERIHIPFDMLFECRIAEENYAYETIHKYKATVRTVLSQAKKNRLIADNYAKSDYIDFPRRKRKKIYCMNDEQAKRYYQAVITYSELQVKAAMLLFLLTGFRRGEVAGLEWGDIDFKENTITINRSITTVIRHGCIEKEPKTEGSQRTVTGSQMLMTVLKEYRIWWELRRNLYKGNFENTNKLFTKENGENIYPGKFTQWNQ